MTKLIAITGPTASGKTGVAIEVARRLGTEIISADSRQIYRAIPIGTAAPTAAQQAAVVHHLVGNLELDSYFSAAEFARQATAIADDIYSRCGRPAVVCGGSVMYLKALMGGIDEIPTISGEIRSQVAETLAMPDGLDRLRIRLWGLDPDYYRQVDLRNPKRVAHAVEICLQSGKPYSQLRTGGNAAPHDEMSLFVLTMERNRLFDRINRRVDLMMSQGLEAEARTVAHLSHLNALNTVGYKEMFAYFKGEFTLPQAVERIKKNTRVYAKKQLTMLASIPRLIPIEADADAAERIISHLSHRAN